jgi:hypothetical protein
MRFSPTLARLLLGTVALLLLCVGCVHKIYVAPEPGRVASQSLPLSLKVEVPWFELEGADHMPGIALLEWTWQDFRRAAIDYIAKRQTFRAVGTEPGELTLSIKSKLAMRYREVYLYRVQLDATLGSSKHPAGRTYVAEGEAQGSSVRWVTASDQNPINEAVRLALDALLTKIEADRVLILDGKGP